MTESQLHIAQLRVVAKRSTQRVVVELDDGRDFELDPEIVVQRGLKSGAPILADEIEALRREDDALRARRRLVHYLSLRVKSVAEARRYLEGAGFPEPVVDAAVDYALERDLLDDRRFAERFVRTRLKTGIYGPLRLLADLTSHGIESSLAEEVLQPQFDLDWQREAAGELAQKRIARSSSPAGERDRKKLYDFLQRRGFQAEAVREIVDRMR